MQAVILAAGFGTRLRPLTDTTPKGLLLIGGVPLLERTFNNLPKSITEIILVTGYLAEQIENYFGEEFNGIKITYSRQEQINGTGSAVFGVAHLLRDKFLVINGDDLYMREDLEQLTTADYGVLAAHSQKSAGHTLLKNENNKLIGFAEPTGNEVNRLTNSGAYCLQKTIFDYELQSIPMRGESIEYSLPHTLAVMANDIPVTVFTASAWLQVGTPEEYERAQTEVVKVTEKAQN